MGACVLVVAVGVADQGVDFAGAVFGPHAFEDVGEEGLGEDACFVCVCVFVCMCVCV